VVCQGYVRKRTDGAQTIYVFNKDYLDLDLDEVLTLLRAQPPLQPPVDGTVFSLCSATAPTHLLAETVASTPPVRPAHLATAYLRAAHAHLSASKHVLSALQHQARALALSAGALGLRALQLADAGGELLAAARRELARQAALLQGLDADLALVGQVPVHPEFLSAAARRARELGERARTLGDYVSEAKMRQVADTCARTYGGCCEVGGRALG
jgi:autophagy-related protein 11